MLTTKCDNSYIIYNLFQTVCNSIFIIKTEKKQSCLILRHG